MTKKELIKLLKQIEDILLETSADEYAMSGEHILADDLLEVISKAKRTKNID